MVTAKFMLAAQGIIQDRDTRSVSVFNILEEVQAEGFPVLIQKMSLLTVLERAPEDHQRNELTLAISLGQVSLMTRPVAVDFSDKLRSNYIINLTSMIIPNPGRLNFVLKVGERVVSEYSIGVEPRNPPIVQIAESSSTPQAV